MKNNVYYYYFIRGGKRDEDHIMPTADYRIIEWSNDGYRIVPPQMSQYWSYYLWLKFLRVIGVISSKVVVFKLLHKGTLVHSLAIVPGYYQTPFIREGEFQVSSVNTIKSHRGKGLATLMLNYIFQDSRFHNVGFWYITRSNNAASVSVAKKAGFYRVGRGAKSTRGLKMFSIFTFNNIRKED